jgi:hypothetical protein
MTVATGAGDDLRALIHLQMLRLAAEFAWRVDHQGGAGVADLFTPDGEYRIGDKVLRGREEIDSFYGRRRSEGKRTSRHLFNNLRVVSKDDGKSADCFSVLTLFVQSGEPPYATSPVAVADYRDLVELCSDGEWRYRGRDGQVVFGEAPGGIGRWATPGGSNR